MISNDALRDTRDVATYALGLDDAIDEGTCQAGGDLLRLRVAVGLAVLCDVVLVRLRGLDEYKEDERDVADTGDLRRTS